MSDELQDDSQKTEEPTARRLEQAREKGQVAKSQEINHWFMILAAALIVGVFGESFGKGIVESLYRFIEQPHAIRLDQGQLIELYMETIGDIGLVLLLPLSVAVIAALIAGIIQNGLIFSTEPLIPKLEKLSLIKGLKRMFSSRSLVEFAKGMLKISLVSGVILILLWPAWGIVPNITTLSVPKFMGLLQSLGTRVLVGVLAAMALIAAVDFLYQKQQHIKKLRMSKQELKEEFKQSEGDPMIKARLRQIRMERARRRMMAAVPEADVVITNPTHYAVALKYESNEMGAPVLTAKGVDAVAMRIREVAKEHDVPIVENPPLSRALYEGVDLDQEVPPEHYKAVAEIIGYIMRLKDKMPGRRGRPRT